MKNNFNFQYSIKALQRTEVYTLRDISGLKKHFRKLKAVYFIDRKIWKMHPELKSLLKNKNIIFLKVNENIKSLKEIDSLTKKLLDWNIDRSFTFVSIGGGVVGDLVGFLSSIYMRGVGHVHVPTTLLAMVDSSVGGKNGVNHFKKKNILGDIKQPKKIFICTSFLSSLPRRDFISGMGEIYKYSLISTKSNIRWSQILAPTEIQRIINLCLKIKLRYVLSDEKDLKGIRQILNLGHTFGHALESITMFKRYRHGEAVLWGILFAACVSHVKGSISHAYLMKIMYEILSFPIPKLPNSLNIKSIYKLCLADKKSDRQNIKMVLFVKNGQIKTNVPVSYLDFKKSVQIFKSLCSVESPRPFS